MLQRNQIAALLAAVQRGGFGAICDEPRDEPRDALRIRTVIKSEAVSCLTTLLPCKNLTVYLE